MMDVITNEEKLYKPVSYRPVEKKTDMILKDLTLPLTEVE